MASSLLGPCGSSHISQLYWYNLIPSGSLASVGVLSPMLALDSIEEDVENAAQVEERLSE